LATVLDAILLQLRRDYFTGGFLSIDHATAWRDRMAFVLGSLATDMVWAGFGVAFALIVGSWLRLGQMSRWFLAAVGGAAPLLLASLLEYQVFAHLGDAFDFLLMFDLVGRRPSEIVAVASGHLLGPALLAGVAGIVVGGVAWALARRFPAGVRSVSTLPLFGGWLVLAVFGTATLTGLRLSSDVLDNGLRRKPSGQTLGTLVGALTDVDRDGFGLMSRPADPAPWDGRVYPYAVDVPGNGVDENGIAGDLPEGPPYTEDPRAAPKFVRKPNLMIVMLETFRADLLGATVGNRAVTPFLDRLAAEGVSVSRAYSHNGYTVQSRYHLFTGSLAGVRGKTTLIDDFRQNGYEVAFFSGQDESFGGPRFDIGTDRADVFYDARQDRARRYTTFTTPGSLGVSSAIVVERVQGFLDAREKTRPLLLYVSLYDTHFPYDHDQLQPLLKTPRLSQSEIVPSRAADVLAMYRNTAANMDAAIEELVSRTTQHLGDSPAIVVLADHGESLFDEGFLGHGYAINDAQTRIPLVVRGLPVTICEPFGQADLRDVLWRALGKEAAGDMPTVQQCDGQRVFQYLGLVNRPRQIAFTHRQGRIVYDLQQDAVRIAEGPWRRSANLDAASRASWLELVHFWERLQAAYMDGGRDE
jgi:hypothetical protein